MADKKDLLFDRHDDSGVPHHGDAATVPPQCRDDAATRPRATIPKQPDGFLECDACAAKPGTPALCVSCLANRWAIADLAQRLSQLQENALAILDATDAGLRLVRRSVANLGQSPADRLESIRTETLTLLGSVEAFVKMIRVEASAGK